MLQLSDKQKEYWINATHRWNIKCGATRSGKTYLDYYLIPKRIRACCNGGLIVLLGNTQGTLQRNLLDPMKNIWGAGFVGEISSDNTVQLFGRKCYALGADKITQASKLQGAGFEYCYGDEIPTWSEQVFNMLKSRLSFPNSTFDGTCNPDSPDHWFKQFLDGGSDIYRQDYTLDDNPFLAADVKENIKRDYAGTIYYGRFVEGLWIRAEGLVYPNFDTKRNCGTIPLDKKGKPLPGLWYVSIDYGTANPCSMGLWCVVEGRAYRVQEYYYNSRKIGRQKTDEEYYTELDKLAGSRIIQEVVVDPSAASFIETIRRHGRFRVTKADNDVLNGIRYTSTQLAAGRILIGAGCKDIIREFGAYAWDDKAGKDTVIKDNDHAMDDMRYFAFTVLKRFRW